MAVDNCNFPPFNKLWKVEWGFFSWYGQFSLEPEEFYTTGFL